MNRLSLKDKTYFGDSKFEIVTTVKLNHIMEKLDVIINGLLKEEIEDWRNFDSDSIETQINDLKISNMHEINDTLSCNEKQLWVVKAKGHIF